MLLLDDKYDMSELHAEGIKWLESVYPAKIEDWDECKPIGSFFLKKLDNLSVVSVVCTLGVPNLYATALYKCCALSVFELLRGSACGCNSPLCTDNL